MNTFADIKIDRLSSSNSRQHYLITRGENFFEASEVVAQLLTTLKTSPSEEDGIKSFVSNSRGKYTAEQIRSVLNERVKPALFVKSGSRKQFLYQRQLLSAHQIDWLSDRCKWLFKPAVMYTLLFVCIVADVAFFAYTDDVFSFKNGIDALAIVGLLLFTVMSSLIHETGHAAACKYSGIRHGGIGFGLYINFPVLYTDVTRVWTLPRKERWRVNIAGVYFQSILLIFLFVAYFLSKDDIIRYMILAVNLGFLLTLNPFFKFDGYWIVSDIIGVPNLRKRSKDVLVYLCNRIRRKKTAQPYLLQIRTAGKIGLLIYAVLVNLFMGYYFIYVIPTFAYGFFHSFPEEMHQLIQYVSNSMAPPFALMRNIFSQMVFMGLIGYMLYKVSMGLYVSKTRTAK